MEQNNILEKKILGENLINETINDNSNEERSSSINITKYLQENLTVTLSRKIRILIFILFLVLSIVVDLDNGIFSSSVEYLDMSPTDYGIFVSVSFIGRIIGLIFFMIVINFKHRKFTLILTIFLHGSSYFLYKISDIFSSISNYNSYLFIFAKIFSAANKVCASVYRPVWIEQFGLSNYKSIFFSLVQIMGSYGQTIGFNLGTLYFKEEWKLALIYIMILMMIIGLLFSFIPAKYFQRKYMYYGEILVDTVDEKENYLDARNSSIISTSSFSSNRSSTSKKKTLFISSKKLKKKKSDNFNFKNLLKDLLTLIKNKIYVLSIIKRSCVTFIFQIIHSYLKVYQKNVFENSDEKLIALFYSISTLVATAIGGLLGGIISKLLGGYDSKKSIIIVIIPEILTCISISFMAFTSDFYIYNINLILFFCLISVNSPVIFGYLITNIPKDIKSIGVGLDMIVSTFLGKIPGPIIYGILDDKFSEENPSYAWKICLSYFYFGFILCILLCYFKYFEEIKENASNITLEEQIVDFSAIGSGSDAHDQFKMEMPVPKKSKKKKEVEIPKIIHDDNENNDELEITIN